jgi:SH3-like domain-containing protein
MGVIRKAGFALIPAALIITPAIAEIFCGSINAFDINVRADSTLNSEIVCILNKGDRVTVVKEFFEWYRIRLPKSAPSYVSVNLLECLPEDTGAPVQTPIPLKEKPCRSARVLGDNVNIRLKPEGGARILGKLNRNTIVNVSGQENSWYKIEPVENSYAWVHKKFVNKCPSENNPQTNKPLRPVIDSSNFTTEGVILPYGKIFQRTATHKLLATDGRTLLLKGNKPGLDALNHRKVRVSGRVLSGTKEKYPVIEISSMEAIN